MAVLNLVNSAKRLLRYVTDLEKSGRSQESIREYESFPNMYVMALGYDTYIRSLFESVYNKECSIANEDRELRRRAFNLENSVRYFKALYVYFDTRIRQRNYVSILKKAEDSLKNSEINLTETKNSAKSSTRWAIASIIFSAVFSIIGLSYSIRTANDSSKQLEEVKSELIKTLNDINPGVQIDTDNNILRAKENSIIPKTPDQCTLK